MANLSNYRANFTDVGGVAMYHQDVTTPLLSVNGKDYLRSGQFVPYASKYATAVARGLGVSGRVDTVATFGGIYKPGDTRRSYVAYAAGKVCRITPIYGASGTYSVAPVDGTAPTGPSLITLPSHEEVGLLRPNVDTGSEIISPPFYLNDSSKWACVAMSGSADSDDSTAATDASSALMAPYLLTSPDGLYWTNAGACGEYKSYSTIAENRIINVCATQVGNVVNVIIKYFTTAAPYLGGAFGSLATTNSSGRVVSHSSVSYTGAGGPTGANQYLNTNHFIASLSPTLTYGIYGYNATLAYFRAVDGTTCANNVLEVAYNSSDILAVVSCIPNASNAAYPDAFVLLTDGTSAVLAAVNQDASAPSNNVAFIPALSSPTSSVVYSTVNLAGANTKIEGYTRSNGSYILKVIKGGADTYTYGITSAGVVTEYANARTIGTADFLSLSENYYTSGRVYDNYLVFKTAGVQQYSTLNLSTGTIGDYLTSTSYFSDFTVTGRDFSSLLYESSTSRFVAVCGSPAANLQSIYTIDAADYNAKNLRYFATASGSPITTAAGLKQVSDGNTTIFTGFGNNNKLLYSSNKGVSWTEVTLSGLTTVYDITYYSGKYVAVGVGSTGNFAHSTDLASWTLGTINAVGTALGVLYTSGTKLLVGNATNFVYYSSNGTTWTASASNIGASQRSSMVREGSTTYLFKSTASSPYRVNKYTSSDDGVTWSAASVVTNISLTASTWSLRNFEKHGTKWHCLVGNTLVGGSENSGIVLETSDFTTFTAVPLAITLPDEEVVAMQMYQNAGTLYLAVSNYSTSTAKVCQVAGLTLFKIKSTTPDYVGTFGEISFNNQIGYVRLS